jgi:DNA-binding phage protein
MSIRHIRLASRLTAAFGDRMLSKSGNPTMSDISAVFAAIKRALKVEVRMQVVMA